MNELVMRDALVFWHTNKTTIDDAFDELCDVLNQYGIELEIVGDNEMELMNEDGVVIE